MLRWRGKYPWFESLFRDKTFVPYALEGLERTGWTPYRSPDRRWWRVVKGVLRRISSCLSVIKTRTTVCWLVVRLKIV